jgi:hypothetical protein
MPDQITKTQETIRYIHRSDNNPQTLPSLSTENIDIYKGEVVVNTSNESPALFIRSGETDNERVSDRLVRIGNTIISEEEPFVGIDQVDKRGLHWYNPSSTLLHMYDGAGWVRVNSVPATEVVAGEAQVAKFDDLIQATSDAKMVSPLKLEQWRDHYGFVSRKKNTFQLYVDLQYGDDSLENDGSDPYRPFLTIARAAIEVARRSYNYPGRAYYKQHTIFLYPGQHYVDNRRGVSRYISLPSLSVNSTGPVNPQTLNQVVTDVDLTTQVITLSERVELDSRQIWSLRDGEIVGSAIISSDITFGDQLPVRNIKGSWLPGDRVVISDLYLLNPPTGGIILPRGCSVVALDPDKTVIRPKYISNQESPFASIFKVTNGCALDGLVFTDSNLTSTHQRCSAVEYVAKEDLVNLDYGYYPKLYYIFVNTQLPALVQSGLTALESELANNDLGYSISIDNCVVKSYYGLNGFVFEYGAVNGNNEVLLTGLKVYTEQLDSNAYVDPEKREYKPEAKNYAVKAQGNVIVKLANSHIKGVPEALVCLGGGQQYITGTHFNDVPTLAVCKGSLPSKLLKESGGKVTQIVPVLPTPITTKNVSLGTLRKTLSLNEDYKLYLNDLTLTPDSYSLVKDEFVFITQGGSTYQAKYSEYGVDYIDGEYCEYLLLNSIDVNTITDNLSGVDDGTSVYIKRVVDRRQPSSKLYWFRIEDVRATPPSVGMILKSSTNEEQFRTYVVSAVTALDSTTYLVAFILGEEQDLPLTDVYPDINTSVINTSTRNKLATEWFLRQLGYSEQGIVEALLESAQPRTLLSQPRVEFVDFSLIDIRGSIINSSSYEVVSAYGGAVRLE